MSQQELSCLVGIGPRNAVSVIDQLANRGLLERNPDPVERRRYSVTLTAPGKRLLSELRDAAEQEERELLGPLSKSEPDTLHTLLAKLFSATPSAPKSS